MRKLILSLPLMLTGLGAAAVTPASADAHYPTYHHHYPPARVYLPPVSVYFPPIRPVVTYYPAPVIPICSRFDVLYRGCAAEPWRLHAEYETRYGADRDASRLQLSGFEVSIREMR
jgi:hypothetical protein